jgi:hypothetical protein
MQFIIDDWYEMVIAGIILLTALSIIYSIIKIIITHGGKVQLKGATIMGEQNENECSEYVKEHTTILMGLKKSLLEMENNREEARKEYSESNKTNQKMFKLLMTSQDAMLEAFQKNNIGNGNIEKSRKALALCFDIRENYLTDQL